MRQGSSQEGGLGCGRAVGKKEGWGAAGQPRGRVGEAGL